MINKAEIHDFLDSMLANPKSKSFLNHLVRAYFPVSQVDKVWEKQEKEMICVLSRVKLISVDEILEVAQSEEFKVNFLANLKTIFDEKATFENPIRKFIGEKLLGIQGKNTTTFMSYPAYQEFYDWTVNKILRGDKHINWLIKSITKDSFNKKIIEAGEERKIKVVKKEINMVSTYSIGDTDSFKALREKFNK
jgi:hypothetical protein